MKNNWFEEAKAKSIEFLENSTEEEFMETLLAANYTKYKEIKTEFIDDCDSTIDSVELIYTGELPIEFNKLGDFYNFIIEKWTPVSEIAGEYNYALAA